MLGSVVSVTKPRKPALVEITWLDAQTLYERIPWDKIGDKGLSEQVTSGYLHPSSDKVITRVAHTYDAEGDGAGTPQGVDITIIPTSWIRRIKRRRGSR